MKTSGTPSYGHVAQLQHGIAYAAAVDRKLIFLSIRRSFGWEIRSCRVIVFIPITIRNSNTKQAVCFGVNFHMRELRFADCRPDLNQNIHFHFSPFCSAIVSATFEWQILTSFCRLPSNATMIFGFTFSSTYRTKTQLTFFPYTVRILIDVVGAESSQSGIHRICSTIVFLLLISYESKKREISASFFGAVIACWSIRIGWFALSPSCCWSSHYQKVILRTKTLISHLAESVVIATAFVFAITSHCHHCHHHSEIIHFPQRERQAKNDSFEFRITFAWDACSTRICHVWVVSLFHSAACGWLTVIPFSSHSVSVSMLLLQWMD